MGHVRSVTGLWFRVLSVQCAYNKLGISICRPTTSESKMQGKKPAACLLAVSHTVSLISLQELCVFCVSSLNAINLTNRMHTSRQLLLNGVHVVAPIPMLYKCDFV